MSYSEKRLAGIPGSVCETCGKPFDRISIRGRRRRYCDSPCRSRARRLQLERDGAPAADLPFAAAIRTALATSDQSLRELAVALDAAGYDLSASTLSQWSRGRTVPHDTDAVRSRLFVLERLAGRPPGELVTALLQTTRTTRTQPSRLRRLTPDADPLAQARALLLERIDRLDGSDVQSLVLVDQTEHHLIGPRRVPLRSEMTLQVLALVDDLDRYWHVYAYDPQSPVTVMAHAGCTRRLVLEDLAPVEVAPGVTYRLAATELRLDRTLAAGEEYAFGLTMVYDTDTRGRAPEPQLRRFISTPAFRRLTLRLTFEATTRPRALYRCTWAAKPVRMEPVTARLVEVDPNGTVGPLVMAFPTPGSYGFTWEWPSEDQTSHEDQAPR